MRFDTKVTILSWLPAIIRRPLLTRYYRNSLRFGGSEFSELPNIVPRHGTALDVGAHLGIVSYALNQLVDRVIAFEPNPALAAMLRGQKLANVEVRQVGVSDTAAVADLAVPKQGAGLGTLRPGGFGEDAVKHFQVETVRLDDLALRDISFVKIDVEGLEEQVLDGAMEMIGREQPTLIVEIEERHNPGALERIVAKMTGAGYSAYFFDTAWRDVSDFDTAIHQDFKAFEAAMESRTPLAKPYVNNFLFKPNGQPATVSA